MLQLVETDEHNEAAFVRYPGSGTWVSLALSRSKESPMADSGRSQLDQEWVEVVQGEIGGRYLLSMLGAEVVSFDRCRSQDRREDGVYACADATRRRPVRIEAALRPRPL